MWGQEFRVAITAPCVGIIPTRVGTSEYCVYDKQKCEDHPHACGDKIVPISSIKIIVGSSPRVWGQVNMRFFGLTVTGIIPTRVGTSSVHHGRISLQEDHPHACGDKTKEIKENSGFAKSTA